MSTYRIKGSEGVVIDSTYFLELPKAPTKLTSYPERSGMIRYNSEWKAFEGVLDFDDGTVEYRRFAQLDSNGQLLTSQLPDTLTSGMQWVGTYAPISDDIDPPADSAYTKLPEANTDNSGKYFIVRGIYDSAVAHFRANTPDVGVVIFTPINPSLEGDWLEIKYYVDIDPTNPNGGNIVVAAFGRIIISNIPITGHEGLVSLSTDTNLTQEFTTNVDRSSELALTDGDWIISDSSKQLRLRQNRISLSAGAVIFDRTFLTSSNRPFISSTGTVQTIIDSILLKGLRRTGDSMYDDGTIGAGRLGVTYGTSTEPSIAFNNTQFDPDTNPGVDPTNWSDTSTGIFHPSNGSIGFTSNGVEKIRISNDQLIVFPKLLSDPTIPNILFSGLNNTNLGISTLNNTIYFVSNGETNVTLSPNNSIFNGDFSVIENTILGTDSSNNLTVEATSTFKSNVMVNGNTILGDNSSDTLTIQSVSTFNGISNFNENVTFNNSTLFNDSINRFELGAVFSSGSTLSFEGADTTTIMKTSSELRFNMLNYNDVSVYDGSTLRTKINRYGIQLPVLVTIDDAVGVDGMIAYSTERNTVVQKSNGTWTTVGSGAGVITSFTTANWILSGSYYTYTITNPNIQNIVVQELSGSNYSPVEVDSIVISPTDAVLSVPASPDLRFNGRVIVQYQ